MSSEKSTLMASKHGRWLRRLGMTLTTAAVLTVCFSVYAMVLRPVVDTPGIASPGPRTDSDIWAPRRPRQGQEMARKYLASQPWAEEAKYILRTEEAFVYFEEWDPLEDDEAVRFTPFAMIWMQKGRKENEDPITIISDSAYVRFANKFRPTSPNAGRVIRAALEGAVQVRGDKGLEVVGRTFIFSEEQMRVWCENHVEFAYGPHKGNGNGLQVDLIPDEVARAQEKLAVKGFKNIKLRRNVSMDLEFRGDQADPLIAQGNAKPANETEPPPFADDRLTEDQTTKKNDEKPKDPTIVKVRSAGSFEFVVASNVATFEDEVRVYQPTEPGKYNSLQSDLMTLYFEPKPKPLKLEEGEPIAATIPNANPDPFAQPQPEPAPDDSFQSVDSDLTFRRLVALGQNVILRSETNDLIAMMHHLDYDAKNRLAKMTSRNRVRVLQKQSEMQSPEIDLLHQERGRVSHIWARGAGWLQNIDEKTQKLAFAAQWKKELRKLPDPRTGRDLIELEGEALVRQPEDQFGLAAEFIALWLDEEQSPEDSDEKQTAGRTAQANGPIVQTVARTPADPEEKSDNDSASELRSQLKPDRLLALRNVAIVSPNFQGLSQRLEVLFKPGPVVPETETREQFTNAKRSRAELQPAVKIVPGQSLASASASNASLGSSSPPGDGDRIPFAPPPAENPNSSSSSEKDEAESDAEQDSSPKKDPEDGPIVVSSDWIRVNVLTYPKPRKSEVSQVWTQGNVDVRQSHGPEELPLHMTGERLYVENRAKDDQVMTLWGSPAHVRDRGMHIEGREIFLDREKNESLVKGAGLLQLPVKRSLDGTELLEPKLLDVSWSENMRFDGLSAKFFGDVRAVLDNDGLTSNMRCEEMNVTLTERISFRDSRDRQTGEAEQIEVANVHCKDGVEFDSYKYEESKLAEVRRGRFAEFTLNQTSGDTSGQGPGEIKIWRRGRGKRASLTPRATVKANRALKPDSAEWEYMWIEFYGTADGNLKQKFNTFHDRVKIVYGPVERSLMVIEEENLTKDAGWMRCHSLRITQHPPENKEETGYVDLLALGNVDLEGWTLHGKFNARADSISYDESKGLYTLRSQGRGKARIWRQTQLGGERSEVAAQLMNFIPARNILKLHQATGLEGVN